MFNQDSTPVNPVNIGLSFVFTCREQSLGLVLMKGLAVRVEDGENGWSLSRRDVMTVKARSSHF